MAEFKVWCTTWEEPEEESIVFSGATIYSANMAATEWAEENDDGTIEDYGEVTIKVKNEAGIIKTFKVSRETEIWYEAEEVEEVEDG